VTAWLAAETRSGLLEAGHCRWVFVVPTYLIAAEECGHQRQGNAVQPPCWTGIGDDQLARRRPRGKIKDAMPTDLTVILEHRPGELARLGEIAGEAGVSIRGIAAFTGEGRGVVHLLLDDETVARCREALERAGMGIADQREVLVIDIEDRPGALGELTRQLADANVNIELAYTTFGGVRVVIATDDLTSARAALA